jgi:hypothetical protein
MPKIENPRKHKNHTKVREVMQRRDIEIGQEHEKTTHLTTAKK